MIVRAYQPVSHGLAGLRYRRLLVPLDCSQRAECILPAVTSLARFHKAQPSLVHVVRRPEVICRPPPTQESDKLANELTEYNQQEAARYFEQIQSKLPLEAQIHLLVSDNVEMTLHELVEQENVDLVVLSAHGFSGGTKWPYGSVVINFIAYGTSPLLIMQDLSPNEVERTQAEIATREYKGH